MMVCGVVGTGVVAPWLAVVADGLTASGLVRLTSAPVPAVVGRTLLTAVVVTLVSLPLAVGQAYAVRRSRGLLRALGVLSCAVPTVLNALVVTLAWLVILQRGGVLDTAAQVLGLPGGAVRFLYQPGSSLVAMVYAVVPMMALVVLAGMLRLDPQSHEAALLLGARRRHLLLLDLGALARPLTLAAMVAYLAVLNLHLVTEYLSGPAMGQLGQLVQQYVLTSYDVAAAAAAALVLAALAGIPLLVTAAIDRRPP
ncbi:MAG: ABC transporter permease subunit [Kineosporiaceae bacterium]